MMRAVLLSALFLVPALAKDGCVECHTSLEGDLQKPAAAFPKDVHQRAGFSCADCHGGDRNTDDMTAAMNPSRGFKGVIARKAVPQLCAHCHADANLMHRFNPMQRVDQYAQYQTSVHGKRIAAGDEGVATCIDCHSVHDIRAVKDPLSPVYPLNLPATCARCHADAKHMAKYKLPTDQYTDYATSVHWKALSKGGDLSAPTCASCHGNHGATPPQVTSVAAVCGTCHAMMEDLYSKSPHAPVFSGMERGGGCVVCHENHAVHKPTSAMLAGDKAVCSQCHDADSAGGKAAAAMATSITKLEAALASSSEILGRASRSGMEVSEAVLKEQEADEALVKAHVAVHTFNAAAVEKATSTGLAIAAETHRAGEAALKERDFRRMGLGIALIAIAITIAGLWLAVRAIEHPGSASAHFFGR